MTSLPESWKPTTWRLCWQDLGHLPTEGGRQELVQQRQRRRGRSEGDRLGEDGDLPAVRVRRHRRGGRPRGAGRCARLRGARGEWSFSGVVDTQRSISIPVINSFHRWGGNHVMNDTRSAGTRAGATGVSLRGHDVRRGVGSSDVPAARHPGLRDPRPAPPW